MFSLWEKFKENWKEGNTWLAVGCAITGLAVGIGCAVGAVALMPVVPFIASVAAVAGICSISSGLASVSLINEKKIRKEREEKEKYFNGLTINFETKQKIIADIELYNTFKDCIKNFKQFTNIREFEKNINKIDVEKMTKNDIKNAKNEVINKKKSSNNTNEELSESSVINNKYDFDNPESKNSDQNNYKKYATFKDINNILAKVNQSQSKTTQ